MDRTTTIHIISVSLFFFKDQIKTNVVFTDGKVIGMKTGDKKTGQCRLSRHHVGLICLRRVYRHNFQR
jgi:hypothetical protein